MTGSQARQRCRKQRYRAHVDALLALARIQWLDDPDRPKQESRVYRCDRCFGFHLTSTPKR